MSFLEDLFSGGDLVPEQIDNLIQSLSKKSYRMINGKISKCDFLESSFALANDDRQIDYTQISYGCYVSTVFLCLDRNHIEGERPVLFETMVFGGDWNGRSYRYRTQGEAKRGHWQIVDCLRAGVEPVATGERSISLMDMFLEAMKKAMLDELVATMLCKFKEFPEKKLTPANFVVMLGDGVTKEEIINGFEILERQGLIEVAIDNGEIQGKLII